MMTLGYECGHKVSLVDLAHEEPPEEGSWTFYPMIVEHPVEIGDNMTCITCMTVQRVNKIYADQATGEV